MFLKKLANLPPRKRIGILALILGITALFADDPYNNASARVNLKSIAINSSKDIDRVTVQELADWLIKGKLDYRLIDLRPENEYQKYNVPSSENVDIENLLNYGLRRNEKIILYADDDLIASQAWFILKASDYKSIAILNGGLSLWKNEILFPVCSCGDNPSPEQLHLHNKLSEVSKYFGGKMQTERISESSKEMKMPELQAPAKIILKKTEGKRKREGC